MKLSDLVSSLQEIFDEFGECEVYISGNRFISISSKDIKQDMSDHINIELNGTEKRGNI